MIQEKKMLGRLFLAAALAALVAVALAIPAYPGAEVALPIA